MAPSEIKFLLIMLNSPILTHPLTFISASIMDPSIVSTLPFTTRGARTCMGALSFKDPL